ncbi:MAG: DUF885 domain-containing protein [Acidimicrobiia bacterium]|nr:DUF885 domain-containing protein [Acidimicrobiia bacterium]NNF09838.1 DUF885 domain-containing protein [Acidimicrobiia bacterium]
MNEALRDVSDEYWEWQLENSPVSALMLGDHRYADRFDEMSREAEDRTIADLRSFAERAEDIPVDDLDTEERITRDVLIFEATTNADAAETRQAEFAVNHVVGFQTMLPVLPPQFPIETAEHADQLVSMYREIGRAFDEMSDRLREGLDNNRTPPRHAVGETVKQIDGFLRTPVEQDPLLNVRPPAGFDEAEVAGWKARLGEAIDQVIRPALSRHRELLEHEVMDAARPEERSGVSWLPDGEELYARAIQRHTSLPLDATEVHEIGLQAIESLADEYRALGSKVLGTSDVGDIFSRLRDDPDLHFSDGAEVVAASAAAMDKARAEMGNWFGRLPQADCVMAETPTGPKAFYFPPAMDGTRPGTFFVNTAMPDQWGRYEIEATSYHEAIPGHHFQLAIAQELDGMPEFRKHAGITAFAEGWGLYTERLADEMGLYETDLDRIGMLSLDSMRAGRLVVDTGLHAMGWSRQQAIEYLTRNVPMSHTTIEDEVDRYIGMPGQALAYMIGRLEIQRIRSEAEETMGDAFDIKGFHDAVLTHGLLPLETLAGVVEQWAAEAVGGR